MELLQAFNRELEKLDVSINHKVLIAVSGGLDSMVLLDLTHKTGLKIVAAHVNYNMRGQESKEDEKLVDKYCREKNILFVSKQVDLSSDKLRDGFQAEARKVRYDWFDEMCKVHHIDYLFTAHHLNDRIETLFINLSRGSGLKGLKSIPQKKKNIRRPLLPFEKKELEVYAKKNQVPWRFDQSNISNKYLRNRIRHGVAKEFGQLSSESERNASKSLDFLAEADQYFQNQAKRYIGQFRLQNRNLIITDLEWGKLFDEKPLHKYVFERLGFYPEQLTELENFRQSQSGKKIEGKKHIVYRDREKFIIEANSEHEKKIFQVNSREGEISEPLHIHWKMVKNVKSEELKNPNLAYLNLSKLTFPLKLRPWEEGDRFSPYGMKGSKKLSDYFIDIKLPSADKERTYVLISETEIVWVVGYRIAHGYGITNKETSIIRFEKKV